jgi:glycosyltransferase involved in cell wall biosynthesis
LKILFIHTKYLHSAGGEDTTVQAESDLMRSKGHEVRVHFFDNANIGEGAAGKINAGISAIYNRSAAAVIRKVLAEFGPDVVHVHNFFFAASPSVLREVHKLRIPLVVTIQNYRLICANALLLRNNRVCELCISHDFPWYGVKYKCYHESAVQSAAIGAMAAVHKWLGTWKKVVSMYITPSAFARNKLIHSSFNVDDNKITVKPNFIDDPGTADNGSRRNHFLFVGRLAVEKGVDTLLDAWSGLPAHQLVLAGDGPEGDKLKSKYGHLTNIQFVGHKSKDEVTRLMKECRALVFPSIWYEGLPLTIIEAFATGTPVIGSNLGAMSEMISDGYNGLLFEAANASALRESIERFNKLVSQNNQSLYTNARNVYLEKYHPEKCYAEVMNIYNAVSGNTKAAAWT